MSSWHALPLFQEPSIYTDTRLHNQLVAALYAALVLHVVWMVILLV